MIAIINQKKKNKRGETLYNLQINKELIATFYHNRSKGLSECLQKAVEAARKYETKKLMEELIYDMKLSGGDKEGE